jgi:FeS assembly SUF system regulator
MIRLSKLTDYGILLMTHMARKTDRPLHTARDLAVETQIPLPTVSKLLKLLSGGGLLLSHRGLKGGYSLARVPGEISVGQIIAVLEGPIGVTECGGAPGVCDMEAHCPMSSNWRVISHALRQALENLTLPDLINPLQMVAKRNSFVAAMELASGRPQ